MQKVTKQLKPTPSDRKEVQKYLPTEVENTECRNVDEFVPGTARSTDLNASEETKVTEYEEEKVYDVPSSTLQSDASDIESEHSEFL